VSVVATTRGSGTIVQLEQDRPRAKCRRWQLRVCVGKDPRTGKYRTRTRRVEGTYTQAKAALRDFIEKVEGDRVQVRTDYTFEQYAERYLERRRLNKEIADATYERQKEMFKAAAAHIGKAKLEAVIPEMLDDMYIAMLKGDTLSGRPSGGSYVSGIHDNVSLVFKQAMREDILVANPCAKANPPRMDTKPKRALTPTQAHEFIERLDPGPDRQCAYLLAITMGLRRGEICGLSWGDVDFDRRVADIRRSYDRTGHLKATKTKAGTRVLPLPDKTLQILEEHKKAQLRRYTLANERRRPEEVPIEQGADSPVISDARGARVRPTVLGRWWVLDRGSYGLDGWCLHEFRHTYLTLLAISGVHPKVMQELAGHYSAQISLDIYTHVNMDSKREAVDAVSKVF
jgi:integrase